MRKVLVLLENQRQYEEFRKHKARFAGLQEVFCVLTPFAQHLCRKQNIPFITPEDCFAEREYYDHKEKSEKKIKELVLLLNGYCSGISRAKIDFSLEVGSYFYYLLYVVIGTLHFNSFILDAILKKEDPDKIVVFAPKRKLPLYLGYRIDPRESPFTSLLENSFYSDRVAFIDYEHSVKSQENSLSGRLKKLIKNIITGLPWLYQYYYFRTNQIPFSLTNLFWKRKINLLLLGPAYNWKHVLRLKKFRCSSKLIWRSAQEFPRPAGKGENIFKEWLNWEGSFCGFDISHLLHDQMSMIKFSFDTMLKSFIKEKKKMARYRAVLCSMLSFPAQNFLAHIARSLNIPVILYQHGEINLFPDALFSETSEMGYIDYYLTFGNYVNPRFNEFLNTLRNFKGCQSVGSTTLDNISQRGKTESKFVLYASGKYLLNSTPFINSIGPDGRLYDAQDKLLAYLENLAKERMVVWKLNNTPIHNQVPFEVKNIIINNKDAFSELLPYASMVILDAPATTALEVCSLNIPLFALLNRIEWNSDSKTLFNKRAVVAYTPEELISRIDAYVKDGHYPADLENKDFIRAFGTYMDDGNSAQRAFDFVYSKIRRN